MSRGIVLGVYLASVYYDVWSMLPEDIKPWITMAFIFAFIAPDDSPVTYHKSDTLHRKEIQEES